MDLLQQDVYTDAPEYRDRVDRIRELLAELDQDANGVYYVTVAIPVTVDFGEHKPSQTELVLAVLDNFMSHPAVRDRDPKQLREYMETCVKIGDAEEELLA